MRTISQPVELPKDTFTFVGGISVNNLWGGYYVTERQFLPADRVGAIGITKNDGETQPYKIVPTYSKKLFINSTYCLPDFSIIFNGYYPKALPSENAEFEGRISYADVKQCDFKNESEIELPILLANKLAIFDITHDPQNNEVYFSYRSGSTGETGLIVVDEKTKTYKRKINTNRLVEEMKSTKFRSIYAVSPGSRIAYVIDTTANNVEQLLLFKNVDGIIIDYVADVAVDNKNNKAYFLCGNTSQDPLEKHQFVIQIFDSQTNEYIETLPGTLPVSQFGIPGRMVMNASYAFTSPLSKLYISYNHEILVLDLDTRKYLDPIVFNDLTPDESISNIAFDFTKKLLVVTTNDRNGNAATSQPCKVYFVENP
jgi:hypothetical protein